MNKKTLKALGKLGKLTAVCHAVSGPPDSDSLHDLASSLAAGRPFLILNFSPSDNVQGSALEALFERGFKPEALAPGTEVRAGNAFKLLKGGELACRIFLRNLQRLRRLCPEIFLVFPESALEAFSPILASCKVFLLYAKDTEAAESLRSFAPALSTCLGLKIWLSDIKPPRELQPLVKPTEPYLPKRERLAFDSGKFAAIVQNLCDIDTLRKNKPEGFRSFLGKFWLPLALLILLVPALIPLEIDSTASILRDLRAERDRIAEKPYFTYTFNGKETLNRIARYAVGRLHATVTTPDIVKKYIAETLDKNANLGEIAEKTGIFTPDSGMTLEFYPPEFLGEPPAETAVRAWKFFTSFISDSIAYITELYHEKPSKGQRQHNGIDLAGRQGARILAPFEANAWTFEDERGGMVLALIRKDVVILFMHCDQILYLNGQKVMQGDPIATVGVTGHTTGPHTHIVTGVVRKDGEKPIANTRYSVMDPLKWYERYFGKAAGGG